MILQNYNSLSPCQFFFKSEVKKCLIRFIKMYGGGSSGALTSVSRTDSATVTWTGDGTSGSPLVATAVIPSNTPNLLITATNGSGVIVDGTANVISRTLTGFTTTNTFITAADSIVVAFGRAQGQLNVKAPLASPALTGTPTSTTAAVGTNTTQIATTAFVQTQLVSARPIVIQNGVTGSRPASPVIGQLYFDTTLSPSKPIWYNGTNWVDATGTTV